MAETLEQQVAVDETEPDTFVSRCNPGRMGNALDIAYGGCTLGVALQAACRTVAGAEYRLYSALGHYLGPARTDRRLVCRVRRIRDTRTFATRLVEVGQERDDGPAMRPCMVVLADFHAQESGDGLLGEYSATPSRQYSPPEKCPTMFEAGDLLVARGVASEEIVRLHRAQFGLMLRFLDSRPAPEGVGANNLTGLVRGKAGFPAEQADLPLTEKASADWLRCKRREGTTLDDSRLNRVDRYASLGFVMDGGLAFLPLSHSGMFLDEAGACSSLDFALRVFTADPDLGADWHLREIKTVTGGEARTYTESRLWDRSGRMVASMTQQSIMRPKRREGKAAL